MDARQGEAGVCDGGSHGLPCTAKGRGGGGWATIHSKDRGGGGCGGMSEKPHLGLHSREES